MARGSTRPGAGSSSASRVKASSHHIPQAVAEKRSSLAWLFSPNRKRSAMEHKFWRHAYFRSIVFLTGCVYFVYCNPEYSHTYHYFRQRMGWRDDAPSWLPQIWKIQQRSRT